MFYGLTLRFLSAGMIALAVFYFVSPHFTTAATLLESAVQ